MLWSHPSRNKSYPSTLFSNKRVNKSSNETFNEKEEQFLVYKIVTRASGRIQVILSIVIYDHLRYSNESTICKQFILISKNVFHWEWLSLRLCKTQSFHVSWITLKKGFQQKRFIWLINIFQMMVLPFGI